MSHLRAVDTDLAQRAALTNHLFALMEHEPAWASSDGERLFLLTERLGDVAAAFNRGHTDIDAEMQKVAATALSWLMARERERAR